MAQYEDRWINGAKYTVPVGTRADWKPGQAYNLTTTAAPTSPSSSSSSSKFQSGTYHSDGSFTPAGSSSGKTQSTNQSTQAKQKSTDDVLSRLQDTMSSYSFPYEQFLRDLMSSSASSGYQAPSESELLQQAKQYAELQVSPLLSAIRSALSSAQTSYDNEKTAIEAAYAGVPARTQSLLEEARQSALESAIARGMGRSGVVDWQTEKLSSPIMQQAQQSEAEKAAKLAAIANTLSSTQSDLNRQLQAIEQQRGTIQSNQLAALRQQAAQTALQEMAARWGQGFNLAQLANTANMSQQSLLTQLIPLLLYG